MARRRRRSQEALPFGPAPQAPPSDEAPVDLPLFEDERPETQAAEREESAAARQDRATDRAAPVGARFLADGLDLLVLAAVAVSAVVGTVLMGLELRLVQLPALVAFMLAFSFLYTTVPLAFWGQTPGMANLDLVCRTRPGQHLSFRQTVLRWAAGLLTDLLLGLPGLLALTGRSLRDRMSGSITYRYR